MGTLWGKIQPWEIILRYFFISLPNTKFNKISKDEEFFKEINKELEEFGENLAGIGEISRAIKFLENQKLIKKINLGNENNPNHHVTLTPKGFKVALDNEKHYREIGIQKKQEVTNKSLSNATIMVGLATILYAFIMLFATFWDILKNYAWGKVLLWVLADFIIVFVFILLFSLVSFIWKKN